MVRLPRTTEFRRKSIFLLPRLAGKQNCGCAGTSKRHPTALWHFFRRNRCGSITCEFKLNSPAAQDASATDLWRLEFPKLRGFQGRSREVFARSTRFEFCILHVA